MGARLALPECKQHENQRNDGEAKMAQGGMRLVFRSVAMGFARHEAGKGEENQHSERIVAPVANTVICLTSAPL